MKHTNNYDSLMIWSAMTLAFFGFLRLGELTRNSQFCTDTHLFPLDVTFYPSSNTPTSMSIKLKISKTDPFRVGQTICIGKTYQDICPLQAMKTYLSVRGNTVSPPFSIRIWDPLN